MSYVKPLPSQELLLELLRYDPETGLLFWRERDSSWFSSERYSQDHVARTWNNRFASTEAFTADSGNGYRAGSLLKSRYYAHRIAFKIIHNEEPPQIDHINHIRDDNRELNLRASCNSENHKNESMPISNTSGVVGVFWSRNRGKWVSTIGINGRPLYLGIFSSKADAIAAREAANVKYGYHANHGKLLEAV